MMRISLMLGATPCTTNRFGPTGGWISAISMLIVKMMPNQIRSQPSAEMMGTRMGMVTAMIDSVSMKQPKKIRSRLIDMNSAHGGSPEPATNWEIAAATSGTGQERRVGLFEP